MGGLVNTIRPFLRAALLGVALAMVVAGCTQTRPTPRQSPGEIPGEVVSTDDALPAEFPEGFPLPGDPVVLYSAVGPLGVSAYFSTGLDEADVTAALLTELPDAGWTIHSCRRTADVPDGQVVLTASSGRSVASVLIGFSTETASRIGGRDFSYLVSIANDAAEPLSMEELDC